MGALSAMAALRGGFGMDMPLERAQVAALLSAAGVLWLALVDRTHDARGEPEPGLILRRLHEGDWLDAAVLPLAFALGALIALDAGAAGSGRYMAGAAAVLLLTVMRHERGSLRDAAVFATVLCALVAAILLLRGQPLRFTAVLAALAAVCFLANRAWPSVSWTMLGMVGLAWGMLGSVSQLTRRPSYEYTPFGTPGSLVAIVVLVAVVAAWRLAPEGQLARVLRGGVLVWAFAWVHQELAFAVNPTVSTLLLVTYYAATSVSAVWVGRARRVALLRHAGLALAVAAAATALYGARHLGAIGARIAADLVAAGFLLAIAYWYRKPGTRDAA